MIAATKVTVGDKDVAIMELTTGDVRAWLKNLADRESTDLVDLALFDDVTLTDLAGMTDLEVADMDAFTPAELKSVIDECKKVNSVFFRMIGRLGGAHQGTEGKPLDAPLGPWSERQACW